MRNSVGVVKDAEDEEKTRGRVRRASVTGVTGSTSLETEGEELSTTGVGEVSESEYATATESGANPFQTPLIDNPFSWP